MSDTIVNNTPGLVSIGVEMSNILNSKVSFMMLQDRCSMVNIRFKDSLQGHLLSQICRW